MAYHTQQQGQANPVRKVLYIFSSLADEDVDWMAANGQRQVLAPGTVLVREGHPVDASYLLLEGSLKVHITKPKPVDLAVLGPGEIIGEVSLIDSRPATATVSVTVPSLVLCLPHRLMQAKLRSDVHFAARFYYAVAVFLAHRFRRTLVQFTGFNTEIPLDEDVDAPDELSLELLGDVTLAGARFDRILNLLRSK